MKPKSSKKPRRTSKLPRSTMKSASSNNPAKSVPIERHTAEGAPPRPAGQCRETDKSPAQQEYLGFDLDLGQVLSGVGAPGFAVPLDVSIATTPGTEASARFIQAIDTLGSLVCEQALATQMTINLDLKVKMP